MRRVTIRSRIGLIGSKSPVLKAAVKQVALNLFPDTTLKFLSIRSRRFIERQVHELGMPGKSPAKTTGASHPDHFGECG